MTYLTNLTKRKYDSKASPKQHPRPSVILTLPPPFYNSLIRYRIKLGRVIENEIEERSTVLDASGVVQDFVEECEIADGHLVVDCVRKESHQELAR